LLALALVALTCWIPSLASAQQGGSKLRIGAGMVLDFGGEVDTDVPGPDPRDDDLKLTPGLRGHLDYDLHRYVSLGGFLRFSWWEADDTFEDRSFLFDIGPRLTGHYDWRDFRFYIAFMPGLTISALNDDVGGQIDNPGFGMAVALTPGFEWWFSRKAALFVEMFGWSGHFFSHDFDFGGDIDFANNQVLWQLGVTFAPRG
jgi:hypothetical protein